MSTDTVGPIDSLWAMAPKPSSPVRIYVRSTEHAINEFAQGVEIVDELEGTTHSTGQLIKTLVTELRATARPKPHPLVYATTGVMIPMLVGGLVMWGGLQARVNALEANSQKIDKVSVLEQKVDDLKEHMQRIEDSIKEFNRHR